MVTSIVREDTEKFGVGPWDLDVKMARDLGYTETEIQTMCDNLATISRNYNLLRETRIATEKKCNFCSKQNGNKHRRI